MANRSQSSWRYRLRTHRVTCPKAEVHCGFWFSRTAPSSVVRPAEMVQVGQQACTHGIWNFGRSSTCGPVIADAHVCKPSARRGVGSSMTCAETWLGADTRSPTTIACVRDRFWSISDNGTAGLALRRRISTPATHVPVTSCRLRLKLKDNKCAFDSVRAQHGYSCTSER